MYQCSPYGWYASKWKGFSSIKKITSIMVTTSPNSFCWWRLLLLWMVAPFVKGRVLDVNVFICRYEMFLLVIYTLLFCIVDSFIRWLADSILCWCEFLFALIWLMIFFNVDHCSIIETIKLTPRHSTKIFAPSSLSVIAPRRHNTLSWHCTILLPPRLWLWFQQKISHVVIGPRLWSLQ